MGGGFSRPRNKANDKSEKFELKKETTGFMSVTLFFFLGV